MYFLLGGDMDLSTLIKYSHKNIKLIVVVVLCCAVLAGAVKILTDYTKYNEEKTNIEALQSEIDSLNSQKNNLLAEKSAFDGDERYKYIKGIDSASLQKYTTVYYIEKNVLYIIL
jgi:outer membrane murein-binding lipoprotein Lpp